MEALEIFKNIATVVGCISACMALLVAIIKPLRQRLIDSITHKAQSQEMKNDIKLMSDKIDKVLKDNEDMKNRLERVEKNVVENEADRIRGELFDCGNRCRRGIRLHPEEFDHIQNVFSKYSNVLHKNHEGEMEYNFICNYYNNQDFPDYHTKNN